MIIIASEASTIEKCINDLVFDKCYRFNIFYIYELDKSSNDD